MHDTGLEPVAIPVSFVTLRVSSCSRSALVRGSGPSLIGIPSSISANRA